MLDAARNGWESLSRATAVRHAKTGGRKTVTGLRDEDGQDPVSPEAGLGRSANSGRAPFLRPASEGARLAGLIAAISSRQDRQAFQDLFAHFAPRIRNMLRRSGCTVEASEDLAQEAMLTVWRKAHMFDPVRAAASTWIFTIARNLRIDIARREKRAQMHAIAEQHEPQLDKQEQPDEIADLAERQARVAQALKILPPDQLQVVMLSFVEGKAHSEIATELGIPMGTVKSRMRLAMGRLRPVLEDLQ